jgi:hypothetical protein
MIELLLQIDNEKTEKAFETVCKVTNKSPEQLIHDWLSLNESLIDIVNVTKRDETLKNNVISICGESGLNDLLGVLK